VFLQRFESQFVLHLQYIVLRSSSGAGGKLDLIGTHMLCSIDHPQSFPFCFSSVNILYASSTGIAAFMGGDSFVNPLCVGFCILWINGCLDETLAKYESVQRLTSEAKTMPSTIEE
jgi:hypothetical protein